MVDWISNPWIIGIGGGIISGVIVYFVTNFIVSKKENRVYQQKINQANSELIHILKPYIITEKNFDEELFNSIVSTLSKKYVVESKDILSLPEALNEIVTDIMQTSFLTDDQKEKYSKRLLSIKTASKTKEKIVYFKSLEMSPFSSKSFSLVLATTTVLMMSLIMIFIQPSNPVTALSSSTSFLIIATIIPIILTVMMLFFDKKRREMTLHSDSKIKDLIDKSKNIK